jgi:tRNA A37 threonylcarbamoyladenosine biosynthesis protein TsaE
MLKYETLPKHHVIYTHLDLGSGKLTHLSVTFLEALIAHCEGKHPCILVGTVPIEKEYADYIRENSGIEQHRYDRLRLQQIMNHPILIIEWDDNTHTVVDGNHRYVKAADLGRTEIKSIILKPALWKTAIVKGFPEPPCETIEEKSELLKNSFSGIV